MCKLIFIDWLNWYGVLFLLLTHVQIFISSSTSSSSSSSSNSSNSINMKWWNFSIFHYSCQAGCFHQEFPQWILPGLKFNARLRCCFWWHFAMTLNGNRVKTLTALGPTTQLNWGAWTSLIQPHLLLWNYMGLYTSTPAQLTWVVQTVTLLLLLLLSNLSQGILPQPKLLESSGAD